MSSLKNNINFLHSTSNHDIRESHYHNYHAYLPRSRTPVGLSTPAVPKYLATTMDSEPGSDEDLKSSIFKEIYSRGESRLNELFLEDGGVVGVSFAEADDPATQQDEADPSPRQPQIVVPPKRAARAIDEDDYDESDGETGETGPHGCSLKVKNTVYPTIQSLSPTAIPRRISSSSAPHSSKGGSAFGAAKASEDARKKLEEDKKASEDAAKRSFHTLFYTLENDRDAMLDQKKLDESERQVDVEMNGSNGGGGYGHSSAGHAQQGTLSQTNLGASSLTLKHLIARIDAMRDHVQASDAELRTLMSEVRKNRSKWASAEKIGQEELYEAAEKVLSELKAMTEHSTAFLTRVNKREAPDYYNGQLL